MPNIAEYNLTQLCLLHEQVNQYKNMASVIFGGKDMISPEKKVTQKIFENFLNIDSAVN